jgi:hypothetical protein
MLPCSILSVLGATCGFGQHMENILDPTQKINAVKFVLLALFFSIASGFLVKWSAIEGYRSVSADWTATNKWKY